VAFERYAVVRVPFPFTDRATTKNRPALVLSAAAFNGRSGHSVLAMITSRGTAAWPLDVPIEDLKSAGLPAPSLVRFKLFTLDDRLIRGQLGSLGAADRMAVDQALMGVLGR
jgi:mRNA interferase MazF